MYVIIGRQHCSYCEQAKRFLDDRNIKYIYIDITSGDCLTDAHWKQFLTEDIQAKTVPQVFKLIGGYDQLVQEAIYDRV